MICELKKIGLGILSLLVLSAFVTYSPFSNLANNAYAQTSSTRERQLTFGSGDDLFPTWSPDGSRLLFIKTEPSVAYVLNRTTPGTTSLWVAYLNGTLRGPFLEATLSKTFGASASWTRDGRNIIYALNTITKPYPYIFGYSEIWVINVDTMERKMLLRLDNKTIVNPAESIDGNIVFGSCNPIGPGITDLYILNSATGLESISSTSIYEPRIISFCVSRDGTRVTLIQNLLENTTKLVTFEFPTKRQIVNKVPGVSGACYWNEDGTRIFLWGLRGRPRLIQEGRIVSVDIYQNKSSTIISSKPWPRETGTSLSGLTWLWLPCFSPLEVEVLYSPTTSISFGDTVFFENITTSKTADKFFDASFSIEYASLDGRSTAKLFTKSLGSYTNETSIFLSLAILMSHFAVSKDGSIAYTYSPQTSMTSNWKIWISKPVGQLVVGPEKISTAVATIAILNNGETELKHITITLSTPIKDKFKLSKTYISLLSPKAHEEIGVALSDDFKKDYEGEIQVKAGNGESKSVSVRVKWESFSSEHILVYYRETDAEDAREAVRLIEEKYSLLTSVFGNPLKDKSKVYVFSTDDEFALTGLDPKKEGGAYKHFDDLIYLLLSGSLTSVLAHELTHRITWYRTNSLLNFRWGVTHEDDWLLEGLADYGASLIVGENGMVKMHIDGFSIEPVSFENRASEPNEYGAAYTFVRFIAESYSAAKVRQILENMGNPWYAVRIPGLQSSPGQAIVSDSTGKDFNTLGKEWKEFVRAKYGVSV